MFSLDVSDEEMVNCDYAVDHERLLLSVLFVNCTSLEVKGFFILGSCCDGVWGFYPGKDWV